MASLAHKELDEILSRVLSLVPPGVPLPPNRRRAAGGAEKTSPTETPRVQQGTSSPATAAADWVNPPPAVAVAADPSMSASSNAHENGRSKPVNAPLDLRKRRFLQRSASDCSLLAPITYTRSTGPSNENTVSGARLEEKLDEEGSRKEASLRIPDELSRRRVRFDGEETDDGELGSDDARHEEATSNDLFAVVRRDLLPVRMLLPCIHGRKPFRTYVVLSFYKSTYFIF